MVRKAWAGTPLARALAGVGMPLARDLVSAKALAGVGTPLARDSVSAKALARDLVSASVGILVRTPVGMIGAVGNANELVECGDELNDEDTAFGAMLGT